MKICTDDEYIEVDPNDVGELEAAMLFKAEHIKAKADPELFAAVAYMLSRLWDTATKRVDVVRCKDCKYCDISLVLPTGRKMYNCMEGSHDHQTLLKSNDFCSRGERRKDREYIDSEKKGGEEE